MVLPGEHTTQAQTGNQRSRTVPSTARLTADDHVKPHLWVAREEKAMWAAVSSYRGCGAPSAPRAPRTRHIPHVKG